VTSHVPAGAITAAPKKRVAAGKVFFGSQGVDLIFDLVVFSGDGKNPEAMNGAGGRTKLRKLKAQFEPCEVREIKEQKQRDKGKQDAPR
jgi:hypothetical protein